MGEQSETESVVKVLCEWVEKLRVTHYASGHFRVVHDDEGILSDGHGSVYRALRVRDRIIIERILTLSGVLKEEAV